MKVLAIVLLFAATAFRPVQPQLSLKDMQGQPHSLSEYKGKVVILNFWATWCVPCKQEMPIFVDVSKKYRDRGVVVVAASLDDDKTRKYIPQFAKSFKMDFPILVDASSDNMHELGLGESIPSTVFLDADGNLVDKIQGQAKRKDVLHRLDVLLAEHPARQ
jgi:thiol-disulfide isomerase/thioredoxin